MFDQYLSRFCSGDVIQPLVVDESAIFRAVDVLFHKQVSSRESLISLVWPDLHVWDFSQSGKIEYTRTIGTTIAQKPQWMHRLCILLDVQFLTESSANSLLKILEESQSGTLFLLTCDTVTSLLPTIRSRIIVVGDQSGQKSGGNEYQQLVEAFMSGERAPLIASILNDNITKSQWLDILDNLQPYIKDGSISGSGIVEKYNLIRSRLETGNVTTKYHIDALFFDLLQWVDTSSPTS